MSSDQMSEGNNKSKFSNLLNIQNSTFSALKLKQILAGLGLINRLPL